MAPIWSHLEFCKSGARMPFDWTVHQDMIQDRSVNSLPFP
jgi:hypothetical protein